MSGMSSSPAPILWLLSDRLSLSSAHVPASEARHSLFLRSIASKLQEQLGRADHERRFLVPNTHPMTSLSTVQCMVHVLASQFCHMMR